MRIAERLALLAAGVALALVSFFWEAGCGDDPIGVSFLGTVERVTGETPAASSMRRRMFIAWIPDFLVANAIAQQDACEAESVLACASGSCAPVSPVTCEFSLELGVPGANFELEFTFVDDVNGNGQRDQAEPEADLSNPIPPLCEGDLVVFSRVDIDFTAGAATAASVEKEIEACPATPTPPPTSTPAATATDTPGETTPTPTPEATTTTTPAATDTPGGPTPTPTMEVTGTPGTPTVTPTTCEDPPSCVTEADCCPNRACILNFCIPTQPP